MTQKIWNYIMENKTINVLNLVLLLILIVPFSYSYSQKYEIEELYWIPDYIFSKLDLIIIFIPILFLTIGFQIANKTVWRNTFLIANLISCLICFLAILWSFFIPIQDFSPGLGSFLLLTPFPLMLIIISIEQFERYKNKKNIVKNV